MAATIHPPTVILMAATWWLGCLRVGGWLGSVRRRLRRDRAVRVSVQVSAALIGRRAAMTGWLEETCRAVFDAQCAPPMPIRVIVTAEAGLPGSPDLGGVRAAYRVTDGPTGRRAIIWLAALQPQPTAQHVDDWLAAGLTWAVLCLVSWEERQPRLAALPLAGVIVPAPPVAPVRPSAALGGEPGPTGAAGAAGPGRAAAAADQRSRGEVGLNGHYPHTVAPDAGRSPDSSRPLAAVIADTTLLLTTSAPPSALSYPAED